MSPSTTRMSNFQPPRRRLGKMAVNVTANIPQINPQHATSNWELLRKAIKEIQLKNPSKLSFEELYRYAYTIVLNKKGNVLYEGLQDVIREHLQQEAKKVEANLDDNTTLIRTLETVWKDHTTAMRMIQDILMYFERAHIRKQEMLTAKELGLKIFREEVTSKSPIREQTREAMLDHIQRERLGEPMDHSTLRSIVQMLLHLGINSRYYYEAEFELYYLERSQQHFHSESIRYIEENDVSSYLKKVENRLKEESDRVMQCLDVGTEDKVVRVVETEMIANHLDRLLSPENSGLSYMLKNYQHDDVARMHGLLKRVDGGITRMLEVFSEYVISTGRGIVAIGQSSDMDPNEEGSSTPLSLTPKDAIKYIGDILDFKSQTDDILEKGFDGDLTFQKNLHAAYRNVLALNQRLPEYLNMYIDDLLRKGSKLSIDEDLESLVEKCLVIHRFLGEKDIFERYYKDHLSRRLLQDKVTNEDLEHLMISRLNTESSYAFTNKLEGMFKDIAVSNDLTDAFKRRTATTSPFDFSVKILTMGCWPNTMQPPCTLPKEFQDALTSFENYYYNQHSGRKLSWQTNLGSVVIRCLVGLRWYELTLSTHQAVLLLNFAGDEQLTPAELCRKTGLTQREVTGTLKAFCAGKHRLLKRVDVDGTTKYTFNTDFQSKVIKIRIPRMRDREAADADRQDTRKKVDEDRKLTIQASIVRVMKARKHMEHSGLISEVAAQLQSRFKPDLSLIKREIEVLIDKEYLERDENNRRFYKYVA